MSAPFRFPKFFVTNPSRARISRARSSGKSSPNSTAVMPANSTKRWAASASAAASPSPIGQAASIARPAFRSACSPREFEASATQRKLLRRHADLEVSACKPWTTEEQYQLLRRYLAARHPGGGMAEMDESDFADMVEQTPVRTYVIEYREPSRKWSAREARRRLPERPAERRPVDDLQLLRCRPRRAEGPRHLHHPRPHHPRRACGPALRLSRLLGRRLDPHGLQDRRSGRSNASAATAGGGWTKSNLKTQRKTRSAHLRPAATASRLLIDA